MRGSPFFDGVAQSDVAIADQPGVPIPIFYYDGRSTSAVFLARLGGLRRLMPDRRFSPARVAPGLGAVVVTCLEYRDTDIGPYNELAIAVVLNEPWFLPNLPGQALLAGLRRRQMHVWIQHLPVTAESASAGGVALAKFPKFVAGIDFQDTATRRVCRLSEGAEHILTLSGERIAAPRSEQFQLFTHLWMDRQPQRSEFKINATEMGVSLSPSAATLELGERHPIARELAELLISRRPIQYQYIPSFEGILYGPEHLSIPLMMRVLEQSSATAPA
jgi:Acetoacetate decarboxylase (ADC)